MNAVFDLLKRETHFDESKAPLIFFKAACAFKREDIIFRSVEEEKGDANYGPFS